MVDYKPLLCKFLVSNKYIYSLLDLKHITHNLAATNLRGRLMLTNCHIIDNHSIHCVYWPSRSYVWEMAINGGIALSDALSMACITMLGRIWYLVVVAKQKFWMQIWYSDSFFIAQIWPNYSYHIEKIKSFYLLQHASCSI